MPFSRWPQMEPGQCVTKRAGEKKYYRRKNDSTHIPGSSRRRRASDLLGVLASGGTTVHVAQRERDTLATLDRRMAGLFGRGTSPEWEHQLLVAQNNELPNNMWFPIYAPTRLRRGQFLQHLTTRSETLVSLRDLHGCRDVNLNDACILNGPSFVNVPQEI